MTALEQYLGGLSDKRVGVIGAGVSNMPLIRMLRASGVRVTVHDKKEPTELGDGYATLATLGVDFVLGEHYLDALDEDVIFRTPGVHPRFLEKAQAGGSEITSEMELFFAVCPCPIIGITGSVGKTTTKDLLHALLSTQGETVAPKGSFNNEIGLPLTALKVGERTRYLVAEMGANHIGEIARLTKIAPPDIAVVLKVGVAHLGEFGSVERIAQAKSEIVRGEAPNAITVLNADDERVAAMSGIAKGDVFWFGIDKAQAHDIDGYMAADDIALDDLGHPVFELVSSQGVEQRVSLGIGGRHNVMNALAAASVAKLLGMPLERIAQVLADTRRISPHRMAVSEVERDGARFTLIDDSFNANPDSMRAGIDGLMAWRSQEDQQPYRVAVLGSMLELGSDEHNLHRTIGAYALDGGVDALICVGGGDDASLNALAQDIADGGTEAKDADDMRPVRAVKTTQQADDLIRALNAEHPDMLVLLKGSHASGLSALATQWAAEAE